MLTYHPGHVRRDKWTALSGPLSSPHCARPCSSQLCSLKSMYLNQDKLSPLRGEYLPQLLQKYDISQVASPPYTRTSLFFFFTLKPRVE